LLAELSPFAGTPIPSLSRPVFFDFGSSISAVAQGELISRALRLFLANCTHL
jgi:hypothetical protein